MVVQSSLVVRNQTRGLISNVVMPSPTDYPTLILQQQMLPVNGPVLLWCQRRETSFGTSHPQLLTGTEQHTKLLGTEVTKRLWHPSLSLLAVTSGLSANQFSLLKWAYFKHRILIQRSEIEENWSSSPAPSPASSCPCFQQPHWESAGPDALELSTRKAKPCGFPSSCTTRGTNPVMAGGWSAPLPTPPTLGAGSARGQRGPRPPGSTCAGPAGAAEGPLRSFLFLPRNTTTSTAGGPAGAGRAEPAALSSARSSPKKPRAPRRPPAAGCGSRLSSSSSSSADGGTALASPSSATRRAPPGSSPVPSTCRGSAPRRRHSAPESPHPAPSPPRPPERTVVPAQRPARPRAPTQVVEGAEHRLQPAARLPRSHGCRGGRAGRRVTPGGSRRTRHGAAHGAVPPPSAAAPRQAAGPGRRGAMGAAGGGGGRQGSATG